MIFAKAHNITNFVKKLGEKDKDLKSQNEYYQEMHSFYLIEDTHVFWFFRIMEGYNDEYENEEGMFLLERAKIDKYDVFKKVKNLKLGNLKDEDYKLPKDDSFFKQEMRSYRSTIFDVIGNENLMKAVIMVDADNGMCNWDCKCSCELDALIEMIDGGYGIAEEKEWLVEVI